MVGRVRATHRARVRCTHPTAPWDHCMVRIYLEMKTESLKSRMAKGFLAETGAHLIGLLPDLGIGAEKIDQVGRGNPQGAGRFADLGLRRLEHVENDSHRRPETRILSAQVQPAALSEAILRIFPPARP